MAIKKSKNKKVIEKAIKVEGPRIENETDRGSHIEITISSPNLIDVTGETAKIWLFDIKKGFSNNLGIELVSSPQFNTSTNRHETTWHLRRGLGMFELNK